jgi:hypothetical protein
VVFLKLLYAVPSSNKQDTAVFRKLFTKVHRITRLITTTQNESEARFVNKRTTAWRGVMRWLGHATLSNAARAIIGFTAD